MKRLALSSLTALALVACQDATQPLDTLEEPVFGIATPPSHLVSWWPGDRHANDIVGQNHGTLQNGATFALGMVEQAFSFDGANDYVQITNAPNLTPGSITVDAWIKPDRVDQFHRIVSKGQAMYDLFIGPAGLLRCILNPQSLGFPCCGADVPIGAVTIPPRVWSHVACTWDAATGQGRVHLNGQQAGGTLDLADNNPLRPTSGDLFIGRAWFGSLSFFDGLIDEVEIFNRALSAAEIQAIFDAGRAGKRKPQVCVSHKGRTLRIAALALQSHLAHGDVQVACPS